MLQIAGIVLPVFLVVLFGFISSRLRLIADGEVDTLLRFITRFAVTALLFRAAATIDLETALDPAILASYYLPAFASFALGILAARALFDQRPGEAVASGFTALFANSLFLGLPIVERAYGTDGLAIALAIVAVHAPTMYFVGIVSMESTARDGAGFVSALGKVSRTLAGNPLFVAVVAGFAVNVIGIPLPAPLGEALALMAQAALPLGMFGIGATLTRYSIGGDLYQTGLFVALSLIVRPLLVVLLAAIVFGLDTLALKVTVMMAAMPGGINIYLFAVLYKRSEALAANVLLIGTVGAIVTVTAWLAILG